MATNVSSVVSHFPDAENGFTTTTAGSVSSGATTVTLNSVSGYTNGQPVVLVIDPTDASKKQTFTGIVDTAGVQITSVVWTAGTNQTHALGATVVDYATATHIAMISKGILVNHSQTGSHTQLTDANGNEWLKHSATASAVNEFTIINNSTGNYPILSASGGDTNIGLYIKPKGSGPIILADDSYNEVIKTGSVASAVNEITVTNAATAGLPVIEATGGDTNINLKLSPKGTGYVQLNYSGAPVQTVSTSYSSVSTGTTTIPRDDTIPQNTEGTEFMSQTITPKSATNILVIDVVFGGSNSIANDMIIALFQDSTADALAATSFFVDTINGRAVLTLKHTMVAGTTSATTFKVRGGPVAAGTVTFNGSAGTRHFGAITKSAISITEYKA